MRKRSRVAVAALPLLAAQTTWATAYTYTATNANWFSTNAWSPFGSAPTSTTDTALIDPAVPANTTYTLTLTTSPNIAAITLGSSGPGTMQLALNGQGLSAANLTIASGGLITGSGKIGTAQPTTLHNSGTLNISGGLNVAPNATSSNNGTLEVANGGTLTLSNFASPGAPFGVIDNTNGTIQALAAANGTPSTLAIGFAIDGGTLSTDASSSITLNATLSNLTATGNFTLYFATLNNVTLNGTLLQWAQNRVTLTGPVTNNANWTQQSFNTIAITGSQTISGTGSITFISNGTLAAAIGQTASLTIGSQQTFQGAGTLGTNANLSLINNGTILANTANQSFTINSPLTNNALLSAAANASISITAPLTLSANAILNADGNISLTSTLTGPLHKTGNATLALSQNYTTTSPISLTAGTLTLNGTTNAAPAITGNGTLALAGALTLTPSTTASTLAGISFANATILAGNYLDLTSNTLIFNPSSSQKSATLSLLQSALTAGTSHSAGIFSSTLGATKSLALLDNAALPTPFTSFGNQPVTANSLILTPELLGDATLDNIVDLNDLNLVLNHLGQSTPLWSSGNFDGAATIDLNDLNAVLNHLGTHGTATLLPATTPAPEPATLATLSLTALLLVKRRR